MSKESEILTPLKESARMTKDAIAPLMRRALEKPHSANGGREGFLRTLLKGRGNGTLGRLRYKFFHRI